MTVKRLCMRDIERLNIFDFLRPYEERIRDIYDREGISSARMFIYRFFNIRMRGFEIRDFLRVGADGGARVAQEAHRTVWTDAGWNGRYSPLGYGPGDKRLELLAAGLLKNGEKILVN